MFRFMLSIRQIFCMSKLWGALPNAFRKSRMTPCTVEPCSIDLAKSWYVAHNWVSHPSPFLNPCCRLYSILSTVCGIVEHYVQAFCMVYMSTILVGSLMVLPTRPFCGLAQRKRFSTVSAAHPCLSFDAWNMYARHLATMNGSTSSSHLLIRSGQAELLFFRLCISLLIPSGDFERAPIPIKNVDWLQCGFEN